jgi:hypothetical protein
MDKKTTIKLLTDVAGGLVFKNRLPQGFRGDAEAIDKLVSYYNQKLVTKSTVTQVVSDLAFKDVLERIKPGEKDAEIILSKVSEIDKNKIAEQANEILSSMPITYSFIFRLPKCTKEVKNIKIAHNIEVLTANDELIKRLYGEQDPEKSFRNLLSDYSFGRQKITKGNLVLIVKGQGFVSSYSTIKLNIIDPLYVWKVAVGVYAGLEILKRQDKLNYLRLSPEFTYDVYSESGENVRSLSESSEDNQYVSRMEFDLNAFSQTELDKILKKEVTLFDYANEVLRNVFSKITFAGGKTDKDVVKQQRMIKNGAYWFYESLKVQQEHVRAIYMTTAFDSLLAANGNEDTKESKADLISISVSSDSLEAHSIRKNIIELYQLRNEIVHGTREVSSLDQYGDWDEKPAQATIFYSLSILARFLRNRIGFINRGLSRVIKITTKT